MHIISQKIYRIYFLILSFAFISACDLTPRLSPEEEDVYTGDLLFYDDQLDLSEHLNPQQTPTIETDLSQTQLRKNTEKISVIGRRKNTKDEERKPTQFLYLQEDITQVLLEENNSDQKDLE